MSQVVFTGRVSRQWNCSWLRAFAATITAQILNAPVALVLFVAGWLKVYSWISTGHASDGQGTPAVVAVMAVSVEMFLGTVLIATNGRVVWHACTVLLFSGFSLATYLRYMNGVSDCGCFGPVSVSPFYTLIFDGFILAYLGVAITRKLKSQKLRLSGVATETLLCGAAVLLVQLAISFTWANRTGEFTSTIGQPSREMSRIDLVNINWIGWDRRETISIESAYDLTTNQWGLLFVRSGCGKCEDLLDDLCNRVDFGLHDHRIVLIDVDPSEVDLSAFPSLKHGVLASDPGIAMKSPSLAIVMNGAVKQILNNTHDILNAVIHAESY